MRASSGTRERGPSPAGGPFSGRRRAALALTVAALAAGAVLLGGALRSSPAPASSRAPALGVGPRLSAGFAAGDTLALVAGLEERAGAEPGDAETLRLLGLAYQQRYRETADASFLTRADEALHRALALEPLDADTIAALASLSLSTFPS